MTSDVDGARPGLTPTTAVRLMKRACGVAGLDSRGAVLIRLGENALVRLACVPVVVRIARSEEYLPQVVNEVAVSRWLTTVGFPAAKTFEGVEQPIVVDGHPVTFWHLITEGVRKASYGDLGRMLKDLHALTPPDGVRLPRFDVFGRTELRIERAPIPCDDRAFLRSRLRELRDGVETLAFASVRTPVHGDAHVQNLMVGTDGRAVLIDFENFSFDHPEWDLMVTAVEHHSLGWQTPAQYADFVAAYGRDLHNWPGYGVLRGIQELRMTTWLMQNVNESAGAASEYRRRIAALRDDSARRDWQPA
ncbi:aminoglycoside phosphotransferase family protein [Streptomyces buecherae]|uniref:phosphotransferase family protein n=1 Tax=Streptomyces buecherae TaxID=2763006 RepID=UPI0033DE853B